jgi:AcrR family transcriptional regulator
MSSQVEAVPAASTGARAVQRRRNPRGMGVHLADEIVAGALRLIDRGATADTLTLRAVAREVGISAPSIYAHFRDRDEIVLAVVTRIFDEIQRGLGEARRDAGPDPARQLLAGCRFYVDFGLEHPERYRVVFACVLDKPEEAFPPTTLAEFAGSGAFIGAEAFAQLVRSIDTCVAAGCSTSTDSLADAVAIWVYLHGLVSLRHGLTRFPWPPLEQMVDETVARLAHLNQAA